MIVKLGEGLNVYLLVAGNSKDVTQLYNRGEGLLASLISSGHIVLLGGTFNEHSVFRVQMTYSQRNEPLGEYEGYILKNETASRFKAMNEV